MDFPEIKGKNDLRTLNEEEFTFFKNAFYDFLVDNEGEIDDSLEFDDEVDE